MRISDWSSDVCSSDLIADHPHQRDVEPHIGAHADRADHQQGCDRIDAVIDEIAIVGPLDAAPAREAAVERIAEPVDDITGERQAEPFAVEPAEQITRSEEHTSELQSLMRITSAV